MKVTSKINIDLRHPNAGVMVDAVQGDVNTRAVEISLFDGGAVWQVPSGVTAALAYKKPDSKQGCLDESASVTVSGSKITIVMTKQMLAAPGTVNACVVLTDASKNQLTSFPFSVSVAANPAADAQQSDEPIKVDTSDATASAEDIVAGKTAYVDGKKVTGTHACPEGLDTSDATAAAADILSGKTAYVNGQKVTGSIASRSAKTITPGTADQTIAAGQYLSGKQTIKGDTNLVADNIKSGVSVFGVDGAYVGTVDIDTSDATANAEDIANGKTAYVNGLKVTGTHECAASAPNLQAKTVTPSESQQTAYPDSGYDGLSSVTVDAVSRTYVGSGVTKKSAATYTPGTADQTIASGQYLSGKQTIKGDANLLASNIKSGVSIFGVAGAYVGQTVDSEICEVHPITIAEQKNDATVSLLTGNAFVAAHCSDDGLFVIFVSLDDPGGVFHTIGAVYHGNRRTMTYNGKTCYGAHTYTNKTNYAATLANGACTAPINDTSYFDTTRLAVNDSGDLNLYIPSDKYLAAGSYLAVLVLAAA